MSEADELRRHVRVLEEAIGRQADLIEKLDFIEAHLHELSQRYASLAETVETMAANLDELAEPMRRMRSVQAIWHQIARPPPDDPPAV